MKVMCEYAPCGPSFVRTGWGRVFSAIGDDFVFWDPSKKCAFDAFAEFEPDIFIGCTYNVDNAVAKCISQRARLKVALFASAWGPLIDKIDRQVYPIVAVSEQEKHIVHLLKQETGQPEFVFIHVTDKYLEETMGGWRSIGITPIGVLNGADLWETAGAVYDEALACDVGFVGGYWPYKARNLNRYLLPLCQPDSGLQVKLFGNSVWPAAQYLGNIENRDVKHLFVSATVCPNVSEPHSTDLNFDLIERPFKILAAGGFCISDYVGEAREIFSEDELLMEKTPEAFEAAIRHCVKYPERRESFIKAGQKRVLANHTYFERVATLLANLGLPEKAKLCEQEKFRRFPQCSQ